MRQRKLMLPSFHGERMQRYGDVMREVAEEEIATLAGGRAVRPAPAHPGDHARRSSCAPCSASTTPSGSRGWASGSPRCSTSACRAARSRRSRCRRCAARSGAASGKRFLRLRAAADAEIYDEIARRRRATDVEDRDDVLSILLQARDEEGRALTDEELRDELMTLLVAGHETTATVARLGLRAAAAPPPAARAAAGARSRAGTSDGEYLDAVIKETLRIRPVVPGVIRKLTAPIELAGYEIPAGHARRAEHLPHAPAPDVYPEPERFRPERFIERPAETYSWIPFGGGVRRCLGAAFATLRDEGRDPGDPARRADARRSAERAGAHPPACRSRSFPSTTERWSWRSSGASVRGRRRPRPSRPDATALPCSLPRSWRAARTSHRPGRRSRSSAGPARSDSGSPCAGRSPVCRS